MRCVSDAPRCAPWIALSSSRCSLGSSRQALLQQLEAAEHRHEQVVEVVGDPAGELADGLHLLRLEQALRGPAPGPPARLRSVMSRVILAKPTSVAMLVADRRR